MHLQLGFVAFISFLLKKKLRPKQFVDLQKTTASHVKLLTCKKRLGSESLATIADVDQKYQQRRQNHPLDAATKTPKRRRVTGLSDRKRKRRHSAGRCAR